MAAAFSDTCYAANEGIEMDAKKTSYDIFCNSHLKNIAEHHSHIMATVYEVDEETLEKLQQKCVEEVKRINGAIWFEDAYRYQHEI